MTAASDDAGRIAELEHALLALALTASAQRRTRDFSPYQVRLKGALSQAHRVLADRRDPLAAPESPLQLVHAAIDYAETHGTQWQEIVALVNRRARLPQGAT